MEAAQSNYGPRVRWEFLGGFSAETPELQQAHTEMLEDGLGCIL